ncbi:MAG: HPr family phosphocarrier protein [Desulfobacteraceae bacterium]|nr:HPr family phosphocarrier protein [Desulfobacteraceae bacterium]
MDPTKPHLSRRLDIINELGLHARSAAKIAEIARTSVAGVWIGNGVETVDASSTLDILTLACGKGSQIDISIDDPSDHRILDEIETLVKSGFGETKEHDVAGNK